MQAGTFPPLTLRFQAEGLIEVGTGPLGGNAGHGAREISLIQLQTRANEVIQGNLTAALPLLGKLRHRGEV